MAGGLEEIGLEVLFHIFYFLSSAKDLCRCSMVCKKWYLALDEREGSPVWTNALEDDTTLLGFTANPLIKKLGGSRAKLVAFENAWNHHDCSRNITLQENQLTLHRKPIAESTDAIRGKCGYLHGQHYWTVTWHSPSFGSNAVIGVATEREDMHRQGYCALLGSTCESWGWDISHRVLRYDGKTLATYPMSDIEVKIGQSIGVTLDMDSKTLSFDLNGYYLGVAFTTLPPHQLFPAVSAVFGGSKISLVYHGPPLVG